MSKSRMDELFGLASELSEVLFKTVGDFIQEKDLLEEREARAVVITAFKGAILAIQDQVDKTFKETLIKELNPVTKPN